MKKTHILMLLIVLATVLVACSHDTPHPLVGVWNAPGGTLEFRSDGTLTAVAGMITRTGTWTMSGSSVTVVYDANPGHPVYGTLDGDHLTLGGSPLTRAR